MERSDLKSEFDGQFVEKVRDVLGPAEADLVLRAQAFVGNRLENNGHVAFKAAKLLLEHGADIATIIAALLAPTLWGASCTLHEISKIFGADVAKIISGFQSLNALRSCPGPNRRDDTHTLLESFAGEPRKAIIKIAFRLTELENALESRADDRRDMAQETLDLYLPIAHRLGLGELCKRLEDASFYLLDSSAYEKLRRRVVPIQVEDEKCLEILIEGVRRLLNKNGIRADIQGRTKSLYSTYRKMVRRGTDLDAIMDRIGLRIIVPTVAECYTVLGLLHSHFKPVPGTFDDYIGLPKENGYQSLHTCVYPVRDISRKPIEFQIRTKLMHFEAEYGAAAHWRYKGGGENSSDGQLKSKWLETLVFQHRNTSSQADFFELLHRQVYVDDLVVFGKAGQIARLPEKATVRDYLKRYHPNYPGDLPVKVNEELVSQDHKLQDGDSVEILPQVGDDSCFPYRPDRKVFPEAGGGVGEGRRVLADSRRPNDIFVREEMKEV